MKRPYFSLLYLIFIFLVSCYQETPVDVRSDFSYEARDQDFTIPVVITFDNQSSGADRYSWTFEGGDPASSDKKQPPAVTYRNPGTYMIRLESRNDFHQDVKEIQITLDSAVYLDFQPQILINSFVPADVRIINNTNGASGYEWYFEGGEPEACIDRQPPLIRYDHPGEYEIRLNVTAGRKSHSLTRKVLLLPRLHPDFEIQPFFECEDMMSPWKGKLKNKTVSGLTYRWEVSGGAILNDTAMHTEVSLGAPGKYEVTLYAGNEKETLSKSLSIDVLPNTNLLQMKGVRLGIHHSTSNGCFFSGRLRKIFFGQEVDDENGKQIDFVFFVLNANFSFCRFVSPDKAGDFVFDPVPNATKTSIVNLIEKTELKLDEVAFDVMKDDQLLQNLRIRENDTGEAYFKPDVCPRIILFETSDGRKGAVKIIRFVNDPSDAFVEADIKVQKEKRIK